MRKKFVSLILFFPATKFGCCRVFCCLFTVRLLRLQPGLRGLRLCRQPAPQHVQSQQCSHCTYQNHCCKTPCYSCAFFVFMCFQLECCGSRYGAKDYEFSSIPNTCKVTSYIVVCILSSSEQHTLHPPARHPQTPARLKQMLGLPPLQLLLCVLCLFVLCVFFSSLNCVTLCFSFSVVLLCLFSLSVIVNMIVVQKPASSI